MTQLGPNCHTSAIIDVFLFKGTFVLQPKLSQMPLRCVYTEKSKKISTASS